MKAVQALLDKVRFLKKEEKQALLQEVGKLTDSREFQEGLQGKILVNGRYITSLQQQDIKAVTELLAEAQTLGGCRQVAEGWRDLCPGCGKNSRPWRSCSRAA